MATLMADAVTEEAVNFHLTWLGSTPNLIAAKLRRLGHYGIPGKSCECPLAMYLQAIFKCKVVIGVYCMTIHTSHDGLELLMPDAVIRFVHGFDNGEYPELICK